MGVIKKNNKITLYHGSDHILQKPLFGFGKADNDYGTGFYTTQDYTKAAEWAINNGGQDSIVNIYDIDATGLNIINLDEYGTLAWIAEIIANRGARGEIASLRAEEYIKKYRIDTISADIIIGYRADDSYIDIVDAFLDAQLNVEEVERLFKKGNLGEQIFLKSQKAFNSVSFRGYDHINEKDYNNEAEFIARSEVAKFLRNRASQIVLNNYKPYGITVIESN